MPSSPRRARSKRDTASTHGIAGHTAFAVSTALVRLGVLEAPIILDDPDGYVDPNAANELLESAARKLGDDAIGLRIASVLAPGSLGMLEYALFINPTWGAGLRMLARYYAVVSTRAFIDLEEHGDEAALVLRRVPGKQSHQHWIELLFAVVAERGKQAFDTKWRPLRVEFVHAAPKVGTDHAAWFGAPVHFGAALDRLVFERRLLGEHVHTGVGPLAEMLEQRLAAIVPPDQDPLVIRTRQMVASALESGEKAAIASIAAKLGMSTRTLQRSLGERGVSYTDLLDGVRQARVAELMRTDDLSAAEIARRVGFADQSALFRALRRWSLPRK